jgi:predicted nuclease with TOPRIM domain
MSKLAKLKELKDSIKNRPDEEVLESEAVQVEDKMRVLRSKLGAAEETIKLMEKESAKMKKALTNSRDKCSSMSEDLK